MWLGAWRLPPLGIHHFEDFPKPFLEAYGRHEGSPGSGAWYEFSMDQADQMIAALRDLGFEVRLAP